MPAAARTDNMSITVNGQSRVPPGFRFHPTEEELLNYYLRKKVACENIDLDVIRDVDLNKLEPWDIQEKCRIGSTPQNDWYIFSHKDKKYPTGTRTNRATAAGFWKATGRDKVIYTGFKRIGMRKTLVFYRGRAPHGQKSDWIMHEYRLDEHPAADINSQSRGCSSLGEVRGQEDGWVVCRVFKKKKYHKSSGSPNNSPSTGASYHPSDRGDGALDQILQYMGRSCKQENDQPSINSSSSTVNITNNPNPTTTTTNNNNDDTIHLKYLRQIEATILGGGGLHERFMKLPALDSPPSTLASQPHDCSVPHVVPADQPCGSSPASYPPDDLHAIVNAVDQQPSPLSCHGEPAGVGDWAALDRLVASHLNGQSEASRQLSSCFEEPSCFAFGCSSGVNVHGGDIDLWTFAQAAASSGSSDHHHHQP